MTYLSPPCYCEPGGSAKGTPGPCFAYPSLASLAGVRVEVGVGVGVVGAVGGGGGGGVGVGSRRIKNRAVLNLTWFLI